MMQPGLPSRIIRSAASRPQRNTPVRFTSITACHCASGSLPTTAPSLTFTSKPSRRMPAFAITQSSRPKSATTRSNAAVICASSATLAL